MGHYLLTGAGFSRNWDGWLASEAFDYLIGCSGLPVEIRSLLWKHQSGLGFEGAYQELRDDTETSTRAKEHFRFFNEMVVGMFFTMQQRFPRQNFAEPIIRFLARFDAIFTLNQDTLLEGHYFNHAMDDRIRQASRGRFLGGDIPGLRSLDDKITFPGRFAPDPEFKLIERRQPYYKLHGSCNWVAQEGGDYVLILGGDKEKDINRFPLLRWNYNQFRDALNTPDSKIVIIGYGFADEHINELLIEGTRHGLRIFLVDPAGANVLDKRPRDTWKGLPPTDLMQALQPALDGCSNRNLLQTIQSDQIEFSKIDRFLNEWPFTPSVMT